MRLDGTQSTDLFKLASKRLHSMFRHEWGHRLISVFKGSQVIAQAVFTDIGYGVKCEVSIWADPHGLAGRDFIRQVCKTAFIDFECKRLHAVARDRDARAQACLTTWGFTPEARLEAWFGDDHGIMFKLLAPQCRWLTKE